MGIAHAAIRTGEDDDNTRQVAIPLDRLTASCGYVIRPLHVDDGPIAAALAIESYIAGDQNGA
jgi:hypothetical protein